MLAKNICLALLGFSAGITAAGGLFSFIIGLGVISDFADRTHTGEQVMLYEDAVAAGGSLGAVISVYHPAVPAKEKIAAFASHNATMVLFLSTGLLEKLEGQLIEGGYKEDTPAAIVYKATWPEEESYICTVSTLAETAKAHGITKTALIIVGDVVTHHAYERSKLYDPEFTTEFRQGVK